MIVDRVIDSIAREFEGYSLQDVEEEPEEPYINYCTPARVFKQWTLEMLAEYLSRTPTPIQLAQAKVLLVDRYFEWRATVSKSHRNRVGENGHVCIFHVFEQAYQQIRMVQLTVTPPQLMVPAPPVKPPTQIQGITLGEVLGEA